jgi:hypothetical protein
MVILFPRDLFDYTIKHGVLQTADSKLLNPLPALHYTGFFFSLHSSIIYVSLKRTKKSATLKIPFSVKERC